MDSVSKKPDSCAPGSRLIRSFGHLFCLLFCLSFSSVFAQTADLASVGQATVPLNGTWYFHPGDDPLWANPGFNDSRWELIHADRPWEAQGHYGLQGFAWYRLHLNSPANPALPLAVYFPAVDSSCEVFWNGRPAGGYGRVPPQPTWFLTSSPFTVSLGTAQPGVLAVRVWKAPIAFANQPAEGGLLGTPLAGSADAIHSLFGEFWGTWLRANFLTLAIPFLSALLSVFAFLFWLRDRSRLLLLWLTIALIYPLLMLPTFTPGSISFRLGYGLIAPVIGANDAAIWLLLLDLLDLHDFPALVRWTRIAAFLEFFIDLLDGSLQLIDWSQHSSSLFLTLDVSLTILPIALELWGVVIVIAALRRKLDAPRWFLAITALLAELLQAADDYGTLGTRWTHFTYQELYLRPPIFSLFGTGLTLRTIVNTLLLAAILFMVWRYITEQTRQRNDLERELRSAREVQRVLIPDSVPPIAGYSLSTAYLPAREVGGDFFQIIPLDKDASLVIIGDVSGKGLQAAMTVSLLVGAIHSTIETTTEPAQILAALTRRLYGRLAHGFATCVILRLGPGNCVTAANAGHLPPILNGQEWELPPALPLGLDPDATYDEVTLHLPANSRLMLYTDGILEARRQDGELFGFERTLAAASLPAAEAASLAQTFGQDDDITILTLAAIS